MTSMRGKQSQSSRRKFVKTISGSAAVAASSAFLNRIAFANPLPDGVSAETSDGKRKFGKCIVKLPINKMGETVMFSTGANMLNGFPCNIIYAFGTRTGIVGMSREPHIHDHDEAIYFIGCDCNSTALGAEVNFKIGPGDGGEEDHIFSVPTVVVIPKGVWHCPMEALKVEKPFLCMAVSMTAHYDVKYWSKRNS